MTNNNNLDALFADAELPFGHPGRQFDDTPEYFDSSPLQAQRPEPDYTPDDVDAVVHYAPGDRPAAMREQLRDRVLHRRPRRSGRLRRLPRAGRRGPAGPQ